MPDRPNYPVSRLDYDLPPELIAQHPSAERTGSRLLHVDVGAGKWTDRSFTDLPGLLPARTLMYFNDSYVMHARMQGYRASGGAVEILFLELAGNGIIRALIGSNAALQVGEFIRLKWPERLDDTFIEEDRFDREENGDYAAEILEPKNLEGSQVRLYRAGIPLASNQDIWNALARLGETPLPPYIKRTEETKKELRSGRYQTVYGQRRGSIAAPTAGLHFTQEMLEKLRKLGFRTRMLTLHVGLGTFAPLRVEDLKDHVMHEERYLVQDHIAEEYMQAYAAGEPVLAVGTTSMRILHTLQHREVSGPDRPESEFWPRKESLPALSGRTAAFIYPGSGTDAARLLLTNFHLPRSTLLALVYAFGGEELMRRVYQHAIEQRYRFFSYGDCMLIDRGS